MMIKIVVSEQRCSNSHSSIECKRLPEVVHATSDAEEHVASSVYRNGSTDPTDKVASAEESLPCEPSPSPAPSNAGELPASNSDTSPICAGNLLDKNYAELLEACCNHDIRNATRILDQSSPEQSPELIRQLVLARDDFRDSALHLASSHAEPEIVRLLLARGADVNAENNLGSTPLNLAAVAGSEQVVEILLDAGADLEHLDDISGTPLHGAARRNHFGCCRLLLNRGARVDAADGLGNRPLHLAAAEGAVSALETLARHYADTQLRNVRGQTPLDVAQASWIGFQLKEKIARVLGGDI